MRTFRVRVGTANYFRDFEVEAERVWVDYEGIVHFGEKDCDVTWAMFSAHNLIWAFEKDNPHVNILEGWLK